jgi:hypothetical protein
MYGMYVLNCILESFKGARQSILCSGKTQSAQERVVPLFRATASFSQGKPFNSLTEY